jgi:hypothetical protein
LLSTLGFGLADATISVIGILSGNALICHLAGFAFDVGVGSSWQSRLIQ